MLLGKQAPTPAWTPHTRPVADVVREYIPRVGYHLFCYFGMLLCVYLYVRRKRKHSPAQQHNHEKQRKMKPKIRKEKNIPVPSRVIISR